MKKIPSLFERDFEGNRQVIDKVKEGSEWVMKGEGRPTVKEDGTSCMIKDGKLYKRYDAKHGKTPPQGWIPCEEKPDEHTGHWPGWLQISETAPEDRWHRAARDLIHTTDGDGERIIALYKDGTYELIGEKIGGNPYKRKGHSLHLHGSIFPFDLELPYTFESIKKYLAEHYLEGIVWHHPDGRMVKIKAKDFGIKWPREENVRFINECK